MKIVKLIEELQDFVNRYGEDLDIYIPDNEKPGYLEIADSVISTSCTDKKGVIDGIIIL